MSYSSSQRELLALYRTVEAKGELLSSKGPVTLWWMTDNSNVSKFLSKGRGRLPIMLQILELLRLARAFSLDIRPIWVRRDHHWLQRADAMSKQIDTDSWSVWQGDFDLFASLENAKVERFFTHAHEAGCSGVVAFTADWHGEWAYIAPPVSLVTRVIRKIAVSKMSGLLLIPLWKSAKFWSFAFPDGRHLCDVFGSLEKLSLRTSNWDVSTKDVIGNNVVTFLALHNASSGSSVLESKVGVGRCFRLLFGKPCYCSK
jgi:hypothetical protein